MQNNEKLMDLSLKFVIVMMMYIRPIGSFGTRASELSQQEEQYPQLASMQSWADFKFYLWSLFGLFVIVSVSAGYRLKKIHEPSSVTFAIAALWFTGPVFIFLEFLLQTAILNVNYTLTGSQLFGFLFGSSFWALVFSAYLMKSKVVAQVYQLPQGWPFAKAPQIAP